MENTAHLMDERQKEIIGGKVVMMSPARIDHQQVSGNIYHFFRTYLQGKSCRAFQDGTKLYLSEEEQFIPDGMIVCDPAKIGDTKIIGAPDLVIEILSPSTANNDKIHKKKVYEKFGVKEYWVISIESRSVEVYLLRNGILELEQIYTVYPAYLVEDMDEAEKAKFLVHAFRCSLFPELSIPLEMIFAQVSK